MIAACHQFVQQISAVFEVNSAKFRLHCSHELKGHGRICGSLFFRKWVSGVDRIKSPGGAFFLWVLPPSLPGSFNGCHAGVQNLHLQLLPLCKCSYLKIMEKILRPSANSKTLFCKGSNKAAQSAGHEISNPREGGRQQIQVGILFRWRSGLLLLMLHYLFDCTSSCLEAVCLDCSCCIV